MTVGRHAVLDGTDVVNVVLWDPAVRYVESRGLELVPAPDQVAPGWKRINGEWVAPAPTPPPPAPTEDPVAEMAKELALRELVTIIGVSPATARTILRLPAQ